MLNALHASSPLSSQAYVVGTNMTPKTHPVLEPLISLLPLAVTHLLKVCA